MSSGGNLERHLGRGGISEDHQLTEALEREESATNSEVSSTTVMAARSNGSENVPVWKKLAYAVGAMPYAMCTTIISLYFSIFLLEAILLDPVYVLVIVFFGRVWDAITDPVVGYLTSLTRTRFGRLRPWMAMATIPTGVMYFFLWFPHTDHWPDYAKFLYYLFCYLALNSLLTCLHVPYVSLLVHITEDNQQRDSITSYSRVQLVYYYGLLRLLLLAGKEMTAAVERGIACELTGTLLAVGIYTAFFVGLVHSSDSSDCDSSGKRVVDPNLKAVYQWHAVTVAIVIVVCIGICVSFIKESQDEVRKSKGVGLIKGLRETLGFKPYFYLLMINIFSWLGFQFIQGNVALYFKYSVGFGSQYVYVIAVFLVSSIAWMIFWQFFISKFGKKTGLYLALWVAMPVLITLLYGNYIKYGSYVVAVILSEGFAATYLIPWSMLPDVISEASLHSSVRREEIFSAFFVFGNKLAGGMTLAVSTGIYKISGYDENSCEQPWVVDLTFKLLMTVPPVLFILITLVFLWFYPITKSSIERTSKLMAERRSNASDAEESELLKELF